MLFYSFEAFVWNVLLFKLKCFWYPYITSSDDYVSSISLLKTCQDSGDNSIAVTQWSAGFIKAFFSSGRKFQLELVECGDLLFCFYAC